MAENKVVAISKKMCCRYQSVTEGVSYPSLLRLPLSEVKNLVFLYDIAHQTVTPPPPNFTVDTTQLFL